MQRTLKDVTEDEQRRQLYTLGEGINDTHKLTAIDFATLMILYMVCTLFFASSSILVTWSLVDQIVDMISLKAINWAKAVHETLVESLKKFTMTIAEIAGCPL